MENNNKKYSSETEKFKNLSTRKLAEEMMKPENKEKTDRLIQSVFDLVNDKNETEMSTDEINSFLDDVENDVEKSFSNPNNTHFTPEEQENMNSGKKKFMWFVQTETAFMNHLPIDKEDKRKYIEEIIRMDSKQRIDVSSYVKFDSEGKLLYDFDQMRQIHLGVSQPGIDVSLYNCLDNSGKPSFDWRQMEQILRCQTLGMDCSEIIRRDDEGKAVYDFAEMEDIVSSMTEYNFDRGDDDR